MTTWINRTTWNRLWANINEIETVEDYYGTWNDICTEQDENHNITLREMDTLHACLDAVAAQRHIIKREE